MNQQPPVPADLPCSCRVCGGVLEAKFQLSGKPNNDGYWILTCWNKTCTLNSVTRSAQTYSTFDISEYIKEVSV